MTVMINKMDCSSRLDCGLCLITNKPCPYYTCNDFHTTNGASTTTQSYGESQTIDFEGRAIWLKNDYSNTIECSNCHHTWSIFDNDDTFNYCPNCGLKMADMGERK